MRRALVTGASRGIGRAVAVALSRRGDRVALHYASDEAGTERTLALLHGSGHTLVAGDLADPQDVEAVARSADDGLGGIDVLVNNAAVAPNAGNEHAVGSTTYARWTAAWREMVDVDLLGAANLTYLVADRLIARGEPGAIVNIGSRGAFRGEPVHPAYGAAKAGLHAFGQSMAVALAVHGIAVTTIAPGFIGTERQEARLSSADGDALRRQSPFDRVGTPEEVAGAVLYLTSPEAQWASGAILDLNGASHLRT